MIEKQNESLQNANAAYEQERRGLEREVSVIADNVYFRLSSVKCCIRVTSKYCKTSDPPPRKTYCMLFLFKRPFFVLGGTGVDERTSTTADKL